MSPSGHPLRPRPQALPPELEYGEVLVVLLAAPVTPGDLYSARLGGVYGPAAAPGGPPYAAGHDGVGVVARVRGWADVPGGWLAHMLEPVRYLQSPLPPHCCARCSGCKPTGKGHRLQAVCGLSNAQGRQH